jgi:hypothetical protein
MSSAEAILLAFERVKGMPKASTGILDEYKTVLAQSSCSLQEEKQW